MTGATAIAGALQLGGVALAPLAGGVIQHLKGRLQGRRGPAPLQPYRDLRRLWRKSVVEVEGTSAVDRLAPAVVAATTLAALAVVPLAARGPDWGLGHDALTIVGLLALGRFATALAAWDTGSGFALMSAARALTFALFAEGVLLLVVALLAVTAGGTTDLLALTGASASAWENPAHWCAALAFAVLAIAETGRQPVDNPDTHLELTMVHEGPLLEYAGRDLALLQWAAAGRLWLMLVLAAGLFGPSAGPFAPDLAIAAAVVAVLCAAVAATETALAKMRVLRVPLFLAGGAALCVAGLAGSAL
jgi:formate hydrogenlyase subunit 4